ncbi:hypothetical protein B0T24DRAFT_586945 [Lasiosphaeria ovina]|uniref:Secreted protein n=1 Tax=Lasiosphaeria ovina TaxID=92902 RepID=A0AAE0NIL2_9PEZI|nr:hypothetical protein B0T24DRAFT_586945 [Lasiosphaeria ovina]
MYSTVYASLSWLLVCLCVDVRSVGMYVVCLCSSRLDRFQRSRESQRRRAWSMGPASIKAVAAAAHDLPQLGLQQLGRRHSSTTTKPAPKPDPTDTSAPDKAAVSWPSRNPYEPWRSGQPAFNKFIVRFSGSAAQQVRPTARKWREEKADLSALRGKVQPRPFACRANH